MEFLDVRFVGGDRRVDVGGHPQSDAVDRPTTANTRIKCMVYVYVSLHGKSGKESAHPWTQIEPSGRLPKLLPSPEDRKQSFNFYFFLDSPLYAGVLRRSNQRYKDAKDTSCIYRAFFFW